MQYLIYTSDAYTIEELSLARICSGLSPYHAKQNRDATKLGGVCCAGHQSSFRCITIHRPVQLKQLRIVWHFFETSKTSKFHET